MIVVLKFDDPCKGQITVPSDFLCVKEFENCYQVMLKLNSNYHNFYHVKQFEVMP